MHNSTQSGANYTEQRAGISELQGNSPHNKNLSSPEAVALLEAWKVYQDNPKSFTNQGRFLRAWKGYYLNDSIITPYADKSRLESNSEALSAIDEPHPNKSKIDASYQDLLDKRRKRQLNQMQAEPEPLQLFDYQSQTEAKPEIDGLTADQYSPEKIDRKGGKNA